MINRIRELLNIRQLSPTQFADLIGVGRPVISHILSERNKPSLEVVQKVISAFPDVSLSWLMSGTGPMLAVATPAANTPAVAPITTQPVVSAVNTAPVAQVQSPVPIENPATPVAPSLAVPTSVAPLAAIVAAPAPLPVAAAVPPVAQPARLPQPPKFRPAAKIGTHSEPSALATAPTPVLPISSTEAPLTVTPPVALPSTPVSEPAVLSSASISPMPPVISAPILPTVAEVPLVAPVYSASVESAAVVPTPVPAPAPVPVSSAEALPPAAPNPAAAFSFLGEAGKTIRRIVLFYSDGSFSDYKPEGQ